MLELTKKIQELLNEVTTFELRQKEKDLEIEMKLYKAERGNETLQERIKEKDNIINDYKDFVGTLKSKSDKGKPEQKQG